MNRSFSIITTCKGRLEHLKLSLPRMLAQGAAEVIVVDYSCPEGTAAHVEANIPAAKVVRIEGEEGFSNWRGRNHGAAAATSDMLVFCDADTILADGAIDAIAAAVGDKKFGYFTRKSTAQFNKAGLRLGMNQLRGFHVVPAAAFQKLGGYDEVLRGYAAGGDTDLEERLLLLGIRGQPLGDGIIEDVIEHDNQARVTFHRAPIKISYGAGLLYRRAKMAILKAQRKVDLPLDQRNLLYGEAIKAARRMARGEPVTSIQVNIENNAIGMPRQLGFAQGQCIVSINVRLDMKGKIDVPPQ